MHVSTGRKRHIRADALTLRNEKFKLEDLQELTYGRFDTVLLPWEDNSVEAGKPPHFPIDATDFRMRFVREIEILDVFGDYEQLGTGTLS
jgi:hypothetical protein